MQDTHPEHPQVAFQAALGAGSFPGHGCGASAACTLPAPVPAALEEGTHVGEPWTL